MRLNDAAMRTTLKSLAFEFYVERELPVKAANGDDFEEITLSVTATAVPEEKQTRDHPGAPSEITDLEIKGPDGEEFAVTEAERARILDAANEAAVGAFEDPRY